MRCAMPSAGWWAPRKERRPTGPSARTTARRTHSTPERPLGNGPAPLSVREDERDLQDHLVAGDLAVVDRLFPVADGSVPSHPTSLPTLDPALRQRNRR